MNQELTFHAWYDANLQRLLKGNLHDALAEAWQAAHSREYDKTKGLIEALLAIENGSIDPWSRTRAGGAIAKYEGSK